MFILGFIAASALWAVGLLTVPKLKAWYAKVNTTLIK